MDRFVLENRLIDFSVNLIKLFSKFPDTYVADHLSKQMIRSGTSPALNYGEACSAESPRDFVHKMGICLKELRETSVCLKIILRSEIIKTELIIPLLTENNELISIFVKSIQTSKRNQKVNR